MTAGCSWYAFYLPFSEGPCDLDLWSSDKKKQRIRLRSKWNHPLKFKGSGWNRFRSTGPTDPNSTLWELSSSEVWIRLMQGETCVGKLFTSSRSFTVFEYAGEIPFRYPLWRHTVIYIIKRRNSLSVTYVSLHT